MLARNPRLTAAGLALFTNQGPGFSVSVTHIALGGTSYDPTGSETALKSEFARFPVSTGATISASQIQIGTLVTNTDPQARSTSNKYIGEIGFYVGTTLLAVLSQSDRALFYKSPDLDVPISYVLDFSTLPPGSLTVAPMGVSDSLQLAAATALASGQAAVAAAATIRASYYGTYDHEPATRPDGAARQKGDRYFDSQMQAERTWNGVAWYIPNVDAAGFAAAGGTTLIGYQHADGVDPTTANAAMRAELTSVNLFFIAGEADHTAMFNRASAKARRVYVPKGSYTVSSANWPSETEFFGDGMNSSVINMPASAMYAFVCNSGSANTANNQRGQRMSNLQLRATVDVDGFSEHRHLVNISGVTGAHFSHVKFVGFRGDAVYVGSGEAGQERHNLNVTFRRCEFDGVNNQNRNPISVIDIDGILVEGCTFINCTRPDMPGAIDFEPNPENTWAIIRNIVIRRNKFKNVGGNVGAVSVMVPGGVAQPAQNVTIEHNTFENYVGTGSCIFFTDNRTPTALGADNDLKILCNRGSNGCRPFFVYGKRITIHDNSWSDFTQSASLAYTNTSGVLDLDSRNNRYTRVGTVGGAGLSVFSVSYVNMTNDKYIDCGSGNPGSSNGLDFNTGTSSYIRIDGVEFSAPAGKMQIAVQKEAGHTFTPNTNSYQRVISNGLGTAFQAEESDSLESSYNPIVTGSTTARTGAYPTQIGRYRRVGKTVFFRIQLVVQNHTGTGIIQVTLPTAVAPGLETVVTLGLENVVLTAAPGAPMGRINPNVAVGGVGAIRCYQTASAPAATAASAVIPSGTTFAIYAEGFYQMP